MLQSNLNNPTKEENSEEMIDAKRKLLSIYFSHEQKHIGQTFIDDILWLADNDASILNLIQKGGSNLLRSNQSIAVIFFQKIMYNKHFEQIVLHFIQNQINFQCQNLNKELQIYFILNIGVDIYNRLRQISVQNQQFQKILIYLSLQLRSLDKQIRKIAMESFYKTIKAIETSSSSQNLYQKNVLRSLIPKMIAKEVLVKQVSYEKGIFLQILQDQFHEIRIMCIRCLSLVQSYIKMEQLKQVIVYMLNDEHEDVRQQALIMIKIFSDLHYSKQDLDTILMCLKEKRIQMRKLVYQNLSNAKFNDENLILDLIDKVNSTLLTYKADKKYIYKLFFQLGLKYSNFIQTQVKKVYDFKKGEEPNWKNIAYKGKLILLFGCWSKMSSSTFSSLNLPHYFVKHMLYIKDFESFLFQNYTEQKMVEQININLFKIQKSIEENFFSNLIQSEAKISQEFHKCLLQICYNLLVQDLEQSQINRKLVILERDYQLDKKEAELISSLRVIASIRQLNIKKNLLRQFVQMCLMSRQQMENRGQTVLLNRCFVSKQEPNTIVSSKSKQFIHKIYIRCTFHNLITIKNLKSDEKKRKQIYMKVTKLQKGREDQNFIYWKCEFLKYCLVQCLILKGEGENQIQQFKILDSFETNQRVQ